MAYPLKLQKKSEHLNLTLFTWLLRIAEIQTHVNEFRHPTLAIGIRTQEPRDRIVGADESSPTMAM